MSKFSTLKEYWHFLGIKKLRWLAPIILLLFGLGIFLTFAETSAVVPVLYTLF